MTGFFGGLFGGGGQGGFMSQPYGDWRSTSGQPTRNLFQQFNSQQPRIDERFGYVPGGSDIPTMELRYQHGQFPLAGSYADIVSEYQTKYGNDANFDPKDPTSVFSKLIKDQQIQTMLANDPRVISMQAQAYVDPMNQLADKASERAMKGHIFANALKVPDRYGEAMARKFDFINPVLQSMRDSRTAARPFSSRITFNV
jgi:hypothetical protein